MRRFDKAAAVHSIAHLKLEQPNRELAEHWLSLWPGDALPQRSALRPAKLKHYLPSIILFNVVPDVSVTVRLAGTRYNHILGAELTGKDWLAEAPEFYRQTRLHLFSMIARGTVIVDHRLVAMSVGNDIVVEEILLPFAADAHGVHQVLVHVNLKADQYLKVRSIKQAVGDPLDVEMVPLKAVEDQLAAA